MNSAIMIKIAAMHQLNGRQAQSQDEPEPNNVIEERHIRQVVNRNPSGSLSPSDGDHEPNALERKISYKKKKTISI